LTRLSRWRRFWRLDLPNGAVGLVWNGRISMGGGWFFLGRIGSDQRPQQDLRAARRRLLTMAIMVLGVNIVFWPLVTWSEKFKNEQSGAAESPCSTCSVAAQTSVPDIGECGRSRETAQIAGSMRGYHTWSACSSPTSTRVL
jgi:hypothetical protein